MATTLEATGTVAWRPYIWLHPSFDKFGGEAEALARMLEATYGRERLWRKSGAPRQSVDLIIFYGPGGRVENVLRPELVSDVLFLGDDLNRYVYFQSPGLHRQEGDVPSLADLNPFDPGGGEIGLGPPPVTRAEWILELIGLIIPPPGSSTENVLDLALPSSVLLVDSYAHFQEVLKEMAADEQRLLQLSPREFEEFFAKLLERDGLEVILTKATRDGGADVLAYRKEQFGKILYAYECKRYQPSNPVSASVVRRLIGTAHLKNASAGIILTTSRFTGPAIEEAEQSQMIHLQNPQDLKTWMQRVRDGQ